MKINFWWAPIAKDMISKRPVYLRISGIVYRCADEDNIESIYLKDEDYPSLDAEVEGVLEANMSTSHRSFRYTTKSVAAPTSQPQLPMWVEQLILLIIPKKTIEYLLGDLAEEYVEIEAKHGVRFAKFWYWKQVIASVWPFLRKVLGWGLVVTIWEWVQ